MNNYDIVKAVTDRGHYADYKQTIPAHECKIRITIEYKYNSKVHYVKHVYKECEELRINNEIESLKRTIAELHANIPSPQIFNFSRLKL